MTCMNLGSRFFKKNKTTFQLASFCRLKKKSTYYYHKVPCVMLLIVEENIELCIITHNLSRKDIFNVEFIRQCFLNLVEYGNSLDSSSWT